MIIRCQGILYFVIIFINVCVVIIVVILVLLRDFEPYGTTYTTTRVYYFRFFRNSLGTNY